MSEHSSQITAAEGTGLDPSQVQALHDRLYSQENLGLGVAAGLIASLAGAAIWAGITVVVDAQIGFMAIGVGVMVGGAVRVAGRGFSTRFGIVGAAFSLFGCALGNLLAVVAFVAADAEMAFMEVVALLDPVLIQELMVGTFDPIDLLFYGIAVYTGYRLSFRQFSEDELDGILGEEGTGGSRSSV